jgi:tetratricopeptide (TPR) repeat protein
MRSSRICLTVVLTALVAPAWAQLPDPPTEDELLSLLGDIRMMAAGNTRIETLQRIEEQMDATIGPAERLNNHGGVLLIARGYPWEGLWFLCRSALPAPENPDVLSNIGFALAFVERHDEAERVLLYTVNRWPDFAPAWTNLARVYLDAEEYDLAEEALEGTDSAEPATAVAEECRARMAVERRNTAAAADALVNLSSLDPTNPLIPPLRDFVPDEDLVAELQSRMMDIPMPGELTELEEIIEDYEEFVLDELHRGFWKGAADASTAVAAAMPEQSFVMTPEIWEQLTPEIRAILTAQGMAPGESMTVVSPSVSRSHYPRLSVRLKHYQERYLAQVPPIFREGAVHIVLEDEQERQREFHRQYKEALDAGDDPVAAMNEWIRDSLGSLNASHPQWLAAMEEAREQANRYTRRYWMTVAGAISPLPEPWRSDEEDYLLRVATLSNLAYTGEVLKWYGQGYMQVVLDRDLAEVMAEALHAAAAAREWQAYCDRMEHERDFEWELEDGANTGPPVTEWWGLNLGVFSIKLQEGQISLSGGEGLVGDASFTWEHCDFEMGIGLGHSVSSPLPGTGAEGKVLAVIRIAGDVGVGLGIREQVQVSAGTPVTGHDVTVYDHYDWLITSGRTRFD